MSRLKIDIGVGLVGTIGVAAVTVRGLAVKPVTLDLLDPPGFTLPNSTAQMAFFQN